MLPLGIQRVSLISVVDNPVESVHVIHIPWMGCLRPPIANRLDGGRAASIIGPRRRQGRTEARLRPDLRNARIDVTSCQISGKWRMNTADSDARSIDQLWAGLSNCYSVQIIDPACGSITACLSPWNRSGQADRVPSSDKLDISRLPVVSRLPLNGPSGAFTKGG